jgi:hypothetical protein
MEGEAVEATVVAAGTSAVEAILAAEVTLPAALEGTLDVERTAVAAGMVATGEATVAMEGERATDITEATVAGVGADLGWDCILRLFPSTTLLSGRMGFLTITPMTITTSGTATSVSIRQSTRRLRSNAKLRCNRRI